MIYKYYSAMLNRSLEKNDMLLPINEEDLARLASILEGGESTLLFLWDGMYGEEIEVKEECGNVMISRRGLSGTEARKFPRGTTLCFHVTLSVVKDLVCNYDCCQDEDCPCEQVSEAGMLLPPGRTGVMWQGVAIFDGNTPIKISTEILPTWMTVSYSTRTAILSGTPSAAGSYQVKIAATNCGGRFSTVQSGTVVIT